METIEQLFGTGQELSVLQMSFRAFVVFFIAFILIRISGRRSFGIGTPLDNIIVILLGAILSRAITGASPFLSIVVAGLVVAVLHRLFGLLISFNNRLGRLLEGDKILLYKNGEFLRGNMRRALVRVEDIMQSIRESLNTTDLKQIDKIYMEHNGEITFIKKGNKS